MTWTEKSAIGPAVSLLLCAVWIFIPGMMLAANGKVTGRVYDVDSREPLPGANVVIESIWTDGKEVALETKQGAAADREGYYVILNVPPGTYNIRASMIGYATLTQKQVRVNVDRTITLDFALTATVLEQAAVEVVAQREVIKPDVSGTQEVILSSRIAETPVLRVDEFVNKIKGVELVDTNEGHGLSIRGGAIRETDVRLDGISLRDPRSENSYLALNSTAVEELQVLTGGFEAKYGGIRSGLVNVVTKEGRRDKYSVSLKYDMTPGGQNKFFEIRTPYRRTPDGPVLFYVSSNPWSKDSWLYRVFADTSSNGWAWQGTVGDTTVPEELRNFKGWKDRRTGNYKGKTLTPVEKLLLWKRHHPQYDFADKPDYYTEGTITGPVPGSGLPFLGSYLRRSTFLLGFKYENTQLAFPIGPRDNYLDWNGQAKITTAFSPDVKLSLNGMYAKVNTVTAGRPSTFGGALIDAASRFNFLNSTESSVRQQAALLGGAQGFTQTFNKSRLQFYDQRFLVGGAKLTHTLSPRTFYTVDLQFSYTDNKLAPFAADTTRPDAWIYIKGDSLFDYPVPGAKRFLDVPRIGAPNGSTNWDFDQLNMFWLYGGLQAADSSYSWVASLRADLLSQVGRHHQIEAGLNANYNYLFVSSGTWLQSEKSWTPDTWQYYKAKPIEIGVYVQDKLEFRGMIANIGLRGDYFNPQQRGYLVSHPLDEDYANFYNLIYQNLPGKWGSWERWVLYRKMLDNPPGWPATKNRVQFKLSPRLGVSFPITVSSKLYFSYGHFYQRPSVLFLYNRAIMPGATNVPTPDLDMARTVAYEFGYEQSFLQNFLFNVTLYYKDVRNEPLNRTYIDYFQENHVNRYFPDSYRDIRGIELRLEKTLGRFITFWGNYDYMLVSSGRTGLAKVYENRLDAIDELRQANVITTDPLPKAQLNLNLHTPDRWGPSVLGFKPLSSLYLNLFYEWQDGGKIIYNPTEPDVKKQIKVDVVDYSNVDLRASKSMRFGGVHLELVATVQNLLNQKRLITSNMTTKQFDEYKASLHLPFESGDQKGNDKIGEWDKPYIKLGWWTAPIFLNPRRVLLGLRMNF